MPDTRGTIRIFEPWDIRDDEPEPVAFESRLNTRRDHGSQATRKTTLIEQQQCTEGSRR
jgi:hypothetical protein